MEEQNVIERFKQAVTSKDAAAAEQCLNEFPYLAERINEPWFSFDSPAIVTAAAGGNRELVDVLLKHGADLHAKSSWWAGGFGVLHHDNLELSRYLIERGAPIDIHAAAALGMFTTVQEMVKNDPASVNERGPDGQVPLHFAVDPDIIDFLLEYGAEIDRRDIDHGSTPAQWAIDQPSKCRHLIARGAAADIFMAVQLGDIELVRTLIRTAPDCLRDQVGKGPFTSGDSDGGHIYIYKLGSNARPLFLAAKRKQKEIVELILEHSSTAHRLLLVCMEGDEAAVQAMLEADSALAQSLTAEDQSIIADAAWNNQVQAVRVMLKAGFDPDARSGKADFTALHNASMRGNVEAVRLLLAHGASTTLKNGHGGNALDTCGWGSENFRDPAGDYAAVKELLEQADSPAPN